MTTKEHTSEYKVFIGQLYKDTDQQMVAHALDLLGSPAADAGIFMVWASTFQGGLS